MKEVQGPTPTGTSRPYRSLAEALRAHRIPVEHHAFISAIVDAVGIYSLIDRGRYIEAVRRGEGAPLHFGRTYVNGFAEHEVVVHNTRPLPLLPSEGRAPYFYVDYPAAPAPVSVPRRTASRTASAPKAEPRTPRAPKVEERDYGVCDVCFMVKTAAGRCGCDA